MPLKTAASGAEYDGVHDPPRQQREQSGDHQRTAKRQRHGEPMTDDIVAARAPHADRNDNQREDRQQVDRAPGTEQANLVDPERIELPVALSPR